MGAKLIEAELFHTRYDHLNFRSIGLLNMKNMVYGLPRIKEPRQIYEEYCKVKQAIQSFKHDLPKKSKKKLEFFHSDMYGPFEVRSKGGH